MLHPLVGLQALDRRHLARVCYLLLVALLGPLLALTARAAGPAFVARNITTTIDPSSSSAPEELVAIGDTLYFSAIVQGYRALWKSDGTDAGTQMVKAVTPHELTNANGVLFFAATNGDTGAELWKSDGTAAGTVMVKAVSPHHLTNVNGTLFFSADDSGSECDFTYPTNGTTGCELWKSDGTAAGTVMVKDVLPGALGSHPTELLNVNGTLFFLASDGPGGETLLWKSNGTTAGTVPVSPSQVPPGGYSLITNMTNVDGTLFFASRPGRLWKTNGMAGGTLLVKEISRPDSLIGLDELTNVNGRLFFVTCAGFFPCEVTLWASDGTTAGTTLVKNMHASNLVSSNGALFFFSNSSAGKGLWKSDGTAAGTTLVKPLAGSTAPIDLTDVNGTLFFTEMDQLWKSDGTAAGTVPVKTITPYTITHANGQVFFVADDGLHGFELWTSDGTTAGTTLAKDIQGPSERGSNPYHMANIDGRLFFVANDGVHGDELWTSDGTPASTSLVKDLTPGAASSRIDRMIAVGQTLFFSLEGDLWRSNGTTAGTTLVKNFDGPALSTNLAQIDGTLFFIIYSGFTVDSGLWRSDGTPAGTALIKRFTPGTADLIRAEDKLFFLLKPPPILPLQNRDAGCCTPAEDPVYGLWTSDGTPAGTTLLNSSPYIDQFVDVQGTVFFFNSVSAELWKSDGTIAGTRLVKPGLQLTNLTNVAGMLFFTSYDATNGSELWKSDGTTAGTRLVKDIAPGAASSQPQHLVNLRGQLFFVADDRIHGGELWKSDGTAAGTSLVKDVVPTMFRSSSIKELVGVGRALYFTAADREHGDELWTTDGTAVGTRLVQDLAPGRAGSAPYGLTVAGQHLFFGANDYTIGPELWALRGDIDAFVQSPVLAGAPPSSPAVVPIQYGNIGIASASALTLTATLDPALTYIGDTSGITPTVSGQTLAWRITGTSTVSGRSFTLTLRTPNAAYGTRYPVALTLAVAGQDSYPADNTATVQVMIARQVYLPLASR